MPGINGVEAFRVIRESQPQTPVILMTAYAAPDLLSQAEREGVLQILPKPLPWDDAVGPARRRSARSKAASWSSTTIRRSSRRSRRCSSAAGRRVRRATSIDEAVHLLAERPPRVVVLDLALDGLQPRDSVLAIRRVNPAVVLILCSGHTRLMDETLSSLPPGWVFAGLIKPFPPRRLLDLLDARQRTLTARDPTRQTLAYGPCSQGSRFPGARLRRRRLPLVGCARPVSRRVSRQPPRRSPRPARSPASSSTRPPARRSNAPASASTAHRGRRALSNAQGRFVLADLPAGRGVLEVSLIGYALVRRDVEVPAGGTLDLTLPLAEGTGTYTEDVEVTAATAQRETGVASQITIGSADIEELRSTLTEDPLRAVQTLAGVGGSDDYRSDFSIRAAPFDHLSVTLDGIPSSLLVHTVRRARDTGSLAMLNSDILEGASVLFGSYPQRYGNRTGSQVDFRMREGSRARRQIRVAVSAIAASAVAEGPIGRARRGSWLVTGRKSYIDWLIHRIDPETTGTFGFVDASGQGRLRPDAAPHRHRHAGRRPVALGRGRRGWRPELPRRRPQPDRDERR